MTLNPIRELITTRRTAKTSLDTPVSKELIIELLSAASFAPFHKKEPWRAIIVTTLAEKELLYTKIIAHYEKTGTIHDEESREKFTKKLTRLILHSPATILFAREIFPENNRLDSDSIQATAALIQNFSLVAWEKGLVGFWASSPFVLDQAFAKAIGLPENFELIANYRLGYRDPAVPKRSVKRRPANEWAISLLE